MSYKDHDTQKNYQNNWIKQRRLAWIALNGPCKNCGSTESLEVDHIDPKLKTMNPRSLWSLSDTNEEKITELENCQVLCKPCHKKKTAEARLRPHGTIGRYSNGCRCDLCKCARKIQGRAERAKKKLLNV
jgi:5-methylcytosine-specific restriction endonuclease McrA